MLPRQRQLQYQGREKIMALTPSSSDSSYITPAEFLKLKDWRTVAQLVMDDGTQTTEADLATNANLAAILMASSGEVESALVASSRYSAADLQQSNGVAKSYLQAIIADIAIWNLFSRRPAMLPPETVVEGKDRAWMRINKLQTGEGILPFTEVQEAGLPTSEFMSQADLKRLNLFSDNCRRSLGIRNQFRRGF